MTYGRKLANDRTIHGTTPNGEQIVRYDRAGKWYRECAGTRRQITFAEAVRLATLVGSYVYLGQPGGQRFDAAVRAVA